MSLTRVLIPFVLAIALPAHAAPGDLDDDGLPDVEEQLLGTDPTNPDSDQDGLVDGEEVFIFQTDPLSQDTDGDQLLDSEEVFGTNTDPLNPDTDQDGLPDGVEVFITGTDPLQPDTDLDGLLDGQEVGPLATSPLNPDTDGDGLLDGEEVLLYGTDPLLPDTDGGGSLDSEEIAAGTDPTDPSDDILPDLDLDGVPSPFDCDDTEPLRFQGNVETCNQIDDDCDLGTDESMCPTQPTFCATPLTDPGLAPAEALAEACEDLQQQAQVPLETCLEAFSTTLWLGADGTALDSASQAVCELYGAVPAGFLTGHDLCLTDCSGACEVGDPLDHQACLAAAERAVVEAIVGGFNPVGADLRFHDDLWRAVGGTVDDLAQVPDFGSSEARACDDVCMAALLEPSQATLDAVAIAISAPTLPEVPETTESVPYNPTNADLAALRDAKTLATQTAEAIDCSGLEAAWATLNATAITAEANADTANTSLADAQTALGDAATALDAARAALQGRMDALSALFSSSVFSSEVVLGESTASHPNHIGVSGAGGSTGFAIAFTGGSSAVRTVQWFVSSRQVQDILNGPPSMGALQSGAATALEAWSAAAAAHAAAQAAATTAVAAATAARRKADAALALWTACLQRKADAEGRCTDLERIISQTVQRAEDQTGSAIAGADNAIAGARSAVGTANAIGQGGGGAGDPQQGSDDADEAQRLRDAADDARDQGDYDEARRLAEAAEELAGDARNAMIGCTPEGALTTGPRQLADTTDKTIRGFDNWYLYDARGTRGLSLASQLESLDGISKGLALVETLDTLRGAAGLLVGNLAASFSRFFFEQAVGQSYGSISSAIEANLKDAIGNGALIGIVDELTLAYGPVWYRDMTLRTYETEVFVCRDSAWRHERVDEALELELGECEYIDGSEITVWDYADGQSDRTSKPGLHTYTVPATVLAGTAITGQSNFAGAVANGVESLANGGDPHRPGVDSSGWYIGACQ